MYSPHTFQILGTAPSGVVVTHVRQGLGQYPATSKGEDTSYLPCQLLLRPLPCGSWDFPGGVGKGVGHKGECPTWEGRKQTGQEVDLGKWKFTLDT